MYWAGHEERHVDADTWAALQMSRLRKVVKMSNCKCPLQIHERRRRTKYPVRVPILTHEEHFFLLSILVDDAIKERLRKIKKLKRGSEKTSLKMGVKLLRGIKRELYRS